MTTPSPKFKNVGMKLFLPYENHDQKTRAGHHTNQPEKNITISINYSSHQKQILNLLQKKKTMKQYIEH